MIWRVAVALIVSMTSLHSAQAQSSFGRTPGKFGVSRVGSAQYSIPIWVPPGPRGIQPNIALFYDSNAQIGHLGIGWAITGLGSIERCNKTVAQDSVAANVALVVADGYCLNGNRLRLTGGTYGTGGSTYQTEIADFSFITANGVQGNGPASFTVQGRDGLTYEYGFLDANGNGVGAQVIATGTTTAKSWLLSKVIDRAGNNYVVNYATQTGTAVPDTILWTPTSAGATTYTYKMKFNYTSNVPQSSPNKYVAGTLVSNTQLLSSIAVSNAGTVIKDYFLTYQASSSTARNELISINECADAAQTNCLLPSHITYQTGSAGVSSTSTPALSSGGTGLVATYDFNGDGIPDLVYNPTGNGEWFVAFGSTSGYGTPLNTHITGLTLFGNVTGGNQDGILAPNGGIWWYYLWNGVSFVGSSTATAVDSASFGYQLADMDGDGLPDLIDLDIAPGGLHFAATVNTRRNTSTAGTASFSSTVVAAGGLSGINSAQLKTPDSQHAKLRRFDFDGDGRDDLALEVQTGTSPNFTIKTYALVSTGTGFTNKLISSATGGNFAPLFFANWNDDACTDFTSGLILFISACNGVAATQFTLAGAVLTAMDWDGDGRTDLLVANGSNIGVYLSTGSGISALQTTTVPYSSTCAYMPMDANGDGLDDLGCLSQTSPLPISYFAHNGHTDVANSFADGYGVTYSPSYVSTAASGGIYTKGTSAAFPLQDYSGPMYVVSSYRSSDGIGGTFNTSYTYAGAILNLQGRGFQGFTTVSSTDSRTGFKDARTYSTGTLSTGIEIPTAGQLLGETVTQSAGTNVSVGTYTPAVLTLDATANNQRYFPYTASSSVDTYEVQFINGSPGPYNGLKITNTTMTYSLPDSYGNFSTVSRIISDEDPNTLYPGQRWTVSTATIIAPSPGTWCNSLPTERDVTYTLTGQAAIVRRSTFVSPDYTNCRETEQVVQSGTAYQVDTIYGYDPNFGTPTSQIVTGTGMSARTTSIAWGTTGQFPTSVKNALNQTSHINFDPNTGKLLSIQDANGITTSWQYDSFGRKIQETRPDKTYTIFTYSDCVNWGGCIYGPHTLALAHHNYSTTGVDISDGTTWFDQMDRPMMTNALNFAGTYDRNDTRYDSLGNIAQQAAPCAYTSVLTPCTYWTTYSHDALGRLTQTQRPISATNSSPQSTLYNYQGRTTIITDPYQKITTEITKVTGKVGRTMDNNGYYVNFNHDSFGSVLSVTDSLSNTLRTMTYANGLKPFRTSLADMDLGTRSYTPDALGEVTAYSDGKGQSFSATYDALSRMTSRTEPDLTSTWTWGATATSFNIGKLASVSSVSPTAGTHTESYTYDSVGHLTDHTIVNPSDGSHSFDYAYDTTTGLLKSLFYPFSYPSTTRVEVGYTYQHGILQQMVDLSTSTVWWQANSINTRGQITQETAQAFSTNPQIVTTRTYDAVTGWLGSIQAAVGVGSTLQNQAYLYDEMGNVTERQDNNLGLTENFYYDSLYRLDHSTLGGSTNLQMGYDAMGDITSRSDIAGGATWTYDPVRKHAVTQAGSSLYTYAYDANGNVTSRNGSIVGFTSYNYPSAVTTSTESASFDYGPDRQRWRMVYTGPTGNETTYYATPMFEVVHTSTNTDYRHYLFAGGGVVMAVSRSLSGAVQRPLLTDHQGSISAIMHYTGGTIGVSESFTAYGNRREANSWTGTPTSTELANMIGTTRQGYTFQTVLGSMGLNHMNGRIEDAVTGRFLSPDPRGTIPGNTQSWNRYSYVINNPLSMSDPSGFDTFCDDSGCTVTGGGGGGAPAPGDFAPSFGPPDLITPTVDVPPVPPPVIIAPDIPEVVVTAPKPTPITADPFDFPSPTVQLADLPLPAPPNIQAPARSPCPNSALANFLYALNGAGQNTVTAGKVTTAGAAGLAIVASPFLLTPAAPGAAAAEGFAGVGATVGVATTLTGYVIQDASGLGLAALGDPGPLLNTSFSVLNSLGLSVTGNGPPNITPINPFSSAVNNMAQSSSCGR
jgi:RHS repeat-associated protein